jgi:hypothetical protein
MYLDGAVKNFFGSPRHIDAVIIPPLDKKISTLEMDRHFPFRPTRKDSGNASR